MQTINITEKQRDKLCDELARLIFEFKKDENVKCIYFTPFVNLDNTDSGVIDITIVRDINDDYDEQLKKYNLSYQSKENIADYGVKICLYSDTDSKYTHMDLNPSDVLRRDFIKKSTILYDESGKFRKIKEQYKNKINNEKDYDHNYLAQVLPPLDETLYKAIDIKKMEKDNKNVSEFVDTETFQYIKNM